MKVKAKAARLSDGREAPPVQTGAVWQGWVKPATPAQATVPLTPSTA